VVCRPLLEEADSSTYNHGHSWWETAGHHSTVQTEECSVLEKFLPTDFPALVSKQEFKSQQVEWDYHHTLAKLEQSQQDLKQWIVQLETSNQQLVEANKTILALTQKIETIRQQVREEVISQVRLLLSSFFEYMSNTNGMTPYEDHVSKLFQFIAQVDPVSPVPLQASMVLTSQELRVLSMIRQGMTNDEIAEQLYIAPTTVKTHRRNIRKKLGLAGAKNRLQTYFQTSEPKYQRLHSRIRNVQ
jgi:DNA-binding NarL/FixJ family response regulator